MRGPWQHTVFCGYPALLRVFQETWYRFLHGNSTGHMATPHFYEQGTSGMWQESFFYGNRPQLIIQAVIFSHRKHRFIYKLFGKSRSCYYFWATNIVVTANIATGKNVFYK
jgi:uncharacterized membrane protein